MLNLYIEDIIRMKKRIILSSGKAHKVKEIKSILKDLPFEVVSKNDLGY